MKCSECGSELEDEFAVLCPECWKRREKTILKWEKEVQ